METSSAAVSANIGNAREVRKIGTTSNSTGFYFFQ
jgi:hypothetical protein